MAQVHDNYQYAHISSLATTPVKNGAGVLHNIAINTKGLTANIATVYDGPAATGAVIGVIDTTANVGFVNFDVQFLTNLTIVTSAGTAADLTVSFM